MLWGNRRCHRRAPVNDIDHGRAYWIAISHKRLRTAGRRLLTCVHSSAFTIYLALSLLFFGRALFGHFSAFHIGAGPDPGWAIWCLVWWPHAIVNGLNLFVTHAIWAPSGFNLTWQTSIPLASASPALSVHARAGSRLQHPVPAQHAARCLVRLYFLPLSQPKLLGLASRWIHIRFLSILLRSPDIRRLGFPGQCLASRWPSTSRHD